MLVRFSHQFYAIFIKKINYQLPLNGYSQTKIGEKNNLKTLIINTLRI